MHFRHFGILFVFLCLLAPGTLYANGNPSLPEIAGWESGELRAAKLDTVSGNQGFWQEREYRTPGGVRVRAILIGGKGPRPRFAISSDRNGTDGPLGQGARYETFEMDGHQAIWETHPLLGASLTLRLANQDASLTLECNTAGIAKEEILQIARQILGVMARQTE